MAEQGTEEKSSTNGDENTGRHAASGESESSDEKSDSSPDQKADSSSDQKSDVVGAEVGLVVGSEG